MALRISEQAGNSDVGRQRHTNEDALLLSPPFFAVADGMGGAQAGEVASQLAMEAFEAERDAELSPEDRLAAIARDANSRIYELASRDESRRGMGTTLTAAIVTGDEVSIGHVGDSRAYRLRDGALEQLTRDHSLVAELERSGQISPEAAEHHPQRSIITRALGPEPEVDVDTYTVAGRSGDVYLLCSDGLTSMVSDEELRSIVRQADDLNAAAADLVRAANQSGGKDNVTVVLFRVEDDAAEEGESSTLSGSETVAGGLTAADVEAEAARRPAAASAPAAAEGAPQRTEPPAAEPSAAPPRRRGRAPRPRRRPAARERAGARRILLPGLLALVLLGAVVAGLYALSRQVYFVGTNDAGLVTLYRGVPYELPLGLDLYEEEYTSGVPARAIARARRGRILDHEWRSREDGVDLVRELERGRIDAGGTR